MFDNLILKKREFNITKYFYIYECLSFCELYCADENQFSYIFQKA